MSLGLWTSLSGSSYRDAVGICAELGPAPPEGTAEYEEWEKSKKEVESEVELRLAETRLSVEGLEESWEKWRVDRS